MSKFFKYESNSIWGLFITIIILLASSFSLAQEFPIYGNGLIYSPKTIKRLRFIADSLNVQYKNCIKNDWNSVEQTYGFHYYEDDTTKINKLIPAIQNGNSRNAIEKILGNIEQLNIDTNLIIRFNNFDKDQLKTKTHIAALGWKHLYDWEMDFELDKDSVIQSSDGGFWIYNKIQSSYNCSWHLNIFYLLSPFKFSRIPPFYNEYINYSQCMIDTSTEVIRRNAKLTGGWLPRRDVYCDTDSMPFQTKFLTLIDAISYPIEEPKDDICYYNGENKDSLKLYETTYQTYINNFNTWEKKKDAYILKNLKKQKGYDQIAINAWKEASENNCFTLNFVDGLAKYYSKSLALDLSRWRIMSELCGQSHSQERHLRDIAFLSAEAGRWDIFLRAHLGVMNDRIRRNVHKDFIKENRGIYLKELEALHLDLEKLFMGTTFRINNSPKHHYYNPLTKTANAIANSKDSIKYKKLVFNILSDQKLDVFNRIVFSFLYKNLLFYSGYNDSKLKLEFGVLYEGIKDLPVFLKNRFLFENSLYFISRGKRINMTE